MWDFSPQNRAILASNYVFPSRPRSPAVFNQILEPNRKIIKIDIFILETYLGTGTYVEPT